MKVYTKTLLISSGILVVTAAIALSQKQITGYELSIYDSVYLPLFSLILSVLINIAVVVISMHEHCKYGKYIGILNIGICTLLVILLPYIKGYVYVALQDNATHIGYILDILIASQISQNNIYPIVHLLGAILGSITGLPPNIIAYLVPPCYYILYIFSIFLVCRLISSENVALIASVCSLTPLCYYYSEIMPMGVGFMTLPVVLFLLIKMFYCRSLNWSILLLVYAIVLPFWHPLTFLTMLVILILFLIVTAIYPSELQTKSLIPSVNLHLTHYIMYIVTISLIVFFLWSLQNLLIGDFLGSVESIFDTSPATIGALDKAEDAFTKLGLNFIEVIFLYIKMYGPLTVFGLFSILGLFYLLSQSRPSIKENILHNKHNFLLIFVYMVFFSCCIIAAVDFVSPLTKLGGQRFLRSVYALIPVPAALGLSLLLPRTGTYLKEKSDLFHQSNRMNIFRSACLILVLAICFSIAIFTLHASPTVYMPNRAITVEEVCGAEWVLSTGHSEYNILYDGKSVSPPWRHSDAIFGTTSDVRYPKMEPGLHEDEFAHFRYDRFSTLGSSIYANKYLMLRESVNLLIYQELYPLLTRYAPLDYILLSGDESVDLLYSNGEMKVYLVSAS